MDAVPLGKHACYATIPIAVREKFPVERYSYEKNLSVLGKRAYRRLDPDSPACSPTKSFCPEGIQGRVMHPTESRVLTPVESLCCMGFAKGRLPDAKLSVGHKIAGNAFSPLVAKAVFEALKVSHKRLRQMSSSDKVYPWEEDFEENAEQA